MLQFASMSKIPSAPSNPKIPDNNFVLPRTMTSVKSHRGIDKKKSLPETAKPGKRFFLTQDDSPRDRRLDTFEETLTATQPFEGFNTLSAGHHTISDKRIKNILGKLDSTVQKLHSAYQSCEKTVMRSTSASFNNTRKTYATFALTEPTMDHTMASTKSLGVQNLLSMTMSDFFNPSLTAKMNQITQSLDLDPRSNQIRDHLWIKINEGRDYYNVLADEVEKKKRKLEKLKERLETYDIIADNHVLEDRIVVLHNEIDKAKGQIEMAEMQTDVLHDMIKMKKGDRDLHRKRFTLQYAPYVGISKELDKNVEEIFAMEKMFQNYMGEMVDIKKTKKDNQKLAKRLKERRKEKNLKEQNFEDNLELERAYQKKRKNFIIKTKKEIEREKQREKEKQEEIEKQKLDILLDEKRGFEENFDLLSTVAKKYEDKEEYLFHLENLEKNNQELEQRVQDLCEEVNLKRKIDLPTLQAELSELKSCKDPSMGFSEGSQLRKQLFEKQKRNEELERTLMNKQTINTNLMRGVMTIFNNVSIVKDYLNLSKLNEVKLKLDNLGDVLLFCGEVLEILNKNQKEPAEIRSQPLSYASLSDDEE